MLPLKHVMLVLGLLTGVPQGARNIDFRDPGLLMMITEYGEIWNAIRDFGNLPEARKIMAVDALVDMLADNRKLRLDGYVFRPSEPDLTVIGGRAEWFIGEVLPRETENSGLSMRGRIEMWKASAASRRTLTADQVAILKTKYAGKIPTGIVHEKAAESIRNLENLLDEWFPFGKSLQEMEGILGVKLPLERDKATLLIDNGRGGQAFQFLLDQGTIRAVKKQGLN